MSEPFDTDRLLMGKFSRGDDEPIKMGRPSVHRGDDMTKSSIAGLCIAIGGIIAFAVVVIQPTFGAAMFILAMAVPFGLGIGVPAYLANVSPLAASTIEINIGLLLRKEPCDREALRRACRLFPKNPNLKALAQLPVTSPIPPELLNRIAMSSTEVTNVSVSYMRWVHRILLAVILLGAVARISFRLFGK